MDKRFFSIGTISDKGYIKRINQDNILVKIGEDDFGEFGLFVVADGMGGLADGHVASKIVIEALRKWWSDELAMVLDSPEISLYKISDSLTKVIYNANFQVGQYGHSKGKKLGTTLSMIFIYRNSYIVKHIGDSRIYLIEDSLKLITEDHSWVAEQVNANIMTLDEAESHKNRNALTRCIGVSDNIDIFEYIGELTKDTGVLLCSDGLYKLVDDFTIYNIVNKYIKKDSSKLQNGVIELLNLVKKNGAIDNVSIVMAYPSKGKRRISLIQKLKEYLSIKRRG